MDARDRILGSLLGTAVGDALGLPYEGLPPSRAAMLLGPPDRYRLFGSRGWVSDDTEHACMALQALAASRGDAVLFEQDLARRLRNWLLQMPAGVGLATLKACLKLALGLPPKRAGVRSAGNGPCMRAVVLGAAIPNGLECEDRIRRSSLLTHTDSRAVEGAFLLAKAAVVPPARFLDDIPPPSDGWRKPLREVRESLAGHEATEGFAARTLGPRGVGGYVLHTVPVVLHAWLTHRDDFAQGVQAAIRCGGDADTTAALVGGILGAQLGPTAIPSAWLHRLAERPRSVAWMTALAEAVAKQEAPPELPVLPNLVRNAGFAALVVAHGLRRLAPPYGRSTVRGP